MGKRLSMLFLAIVLANVLSGCSAAREEEKIASSNNALQNGSKNIDEEKSPQNNKDVELVVWGAEEDETLLQIGRAHV